VERLPIYFVLASTLWARANLNMEGRRLLLQRVHPRALALGQGGKAEMEQDQLVATRAHPGRWPKPAGLYSRE